MIESQQHHEHAGQDHQQPLSLADEAGLHHHPAQQGADHAEQGIHRDAAGVVGQQRQRVVAPVAQGEAPVDAATHTDAVKGAEQTGNEGQGEGEFSVHNSPWMIRSSSSGVDSPRILVCSLPERSAMKVVGSPLTP